ncbi:hypothetical protein ACFQ6Q_04290 [Streptomyces sp. NPDC056437]|uniref:hypothetical protein n=1 Tax=Streptomyces sp. NPDC056437 TaxID=3345816 RepID=UPI003683993D
MPETYRPAARLREGDFIARADGSFQEITSLVQVLKPVGFAMVTLADGFKVNIPHTHEVNCRTAKQQAKAGVSDGS